MNNALSARSILRIHNRELSRISDALRTPLTSIVGFAEAILSNPALEPKRRTEFATIIKSEGERLSKFVDEMLCLSFADPESFDREETEFDVPSLLESTIHTVALRMNLPPENFGWQVLPATLTIKSDRQFIASVVESLLRNAARFLPEDGTIKVLAEQARSELRLTVIAPRKDGPQPTTPASFGLARTHYLVALHRGMLRVTQLQSGEMRTELRLPVSGATDPLE